MDHASPPLSCAVTAHGDSDDGPQEKKFRSSTLLFAVCDQNQTGSHLSCDAAEGSTRKVEVVESGSLRGDGRSPDSAGSAAIPEAD